jgi:hypothetical protein
MYHGQTLVKGLCNTEPLLTPARVPSELFGSLRVRLSGLSLTDKLVFLMGTHDRLGWRDGKLAPDSCKHRGKKTAVLVPCVFSAVDLMLLKMIIDLADWLSPSVLRPYRGP